MQQQGGSHFGVPPLEMVPRLASASPAGRRQQQRMIGVHVGGDPPAAEAAWPISSRSALPQPQGAGPMILDELGGGGGDGPAMRSFADEEAVGAGEEVERGGSRWPRQETLALLKIRSEMSAAFRDATLKGPVWEGVSRKLAELGYSRSAKKCKEKFENVHKYYKRTKEGRAGRQDGKSYRFFSQLEALHAATASSLSPSLPTAPSIAAPPLDRAEPPPAVAIAAGGISSSSNSSSPSSSDAEDGRRKRKRAGRPCAAGKTMAFFEKLTKRLIAQQEAMQRRFLETIEKREQDRVGREEAWKRQEMARLHREYELMKQERSLTASRDAAVISFLQKLGNYHPNPSLVAGVSSATAAREEPPPQDEQRRQQGNEIAIHQLSASAEPAAAAAALSSRWPKAEVLALIKLRSSLEMKYLEAGPKGALWEEISLGMKQLGYSRSPKRCKEKWENINKYFKKVKEGNKKRSEDAKTCPYFHELDAIYRRKQRQKESGESNPAPKVVSLSAEQEKNVGIVRSNGGNGGNNEGSDFQMSRSNIANGLPRSLCGEASNSGSDANLLKKADDIVQELMERQSHEEEEDVDDDDEDDDDGGMRYEILFQRPSVGAAGGSHGGNAAREAPASATPSSNAGSFFAMVQ